ncbi:MAG: carbon storage regulator [Deltaproteobacteria bacterium]|nr:carbon storage regulator [Deltaproteobacteria bacterium]
MLVLSRKQGQSIVIGNDIVVTIREVHGRTVRVSIETPAGMPVYREEIHKEIVLENRRAALGAASVDARLSETDAVLGAGRPPKEGP